MQHPGYCAHCGHVQPNLPDQKPNYAMACMLGTCSSDNCCTHTCRLSESILENIIWYTYLSHCCILCQLGGFSLVVVIVGLFVPLCVP